MERKLTPSFTLLERQDDNLIDILDYLEPKLKQKILIKFRWYKISHKRYSFIVNSVPKHIIQEMLEADRFIGHLLFDDHVSHELQFLTCNILSSRDYIYVHQCRDLISGIFVVSHEARTYIINELIKEFESIYLK